MKRKLLADKAIRDARPKKDVHKYQRPQKIEDIKRLIRTTVSTSEDGHALKQWILELAESIYNRNYFRRAEDAFYEHVERYEKKIPVMLKPGITHGFSFTQCPQPGEQAEIVQVHTGGKRIGFWVTTDRMKFNKVKPYWISWRCADFYAEYEPYAVEKMKASHAATNVFTLKTHEAVKPVP